jgi:tryptophan synthase beta chain
VHPSPSDQTEYGSKLLAEDPNCPGSLGIAISEAIEDTVKHPHTKYSLGSVLNHVCLHQTVIGQEATKQIEMAGEEPDTIVACCGGGSNFCGLGIPFIGKKITQKKYRIVGVERAVLPDYAVGWYVGEGLNECRCPQYRHFQAVLAEWPDWATTPWDDPGRSRAL